MGGGAHLEESLSSPLLLVGLSTFWFHDVSFGRLKLHNIKCYIQMITIYNNLPPIIPPLSRVRIELSDKLADRGY